MFISQLIGLGYNYNVIIQARRYIIKLKKNNYKG